jgi:hypothetical protein
VDREHKEGGASCSATTDVGIRERGCNLARGSEVHVF